MWSVPESNACVRRAFVHDIVLQLTRAVSAAQRLRNMDGKCRTAAPHTQKQWLIANMSNRVCWLLMPSIVCDVMWLMSAQCHMCTKVDGALSEMATTVSLSTVPRLSLLSRQSCRLRVGKRTHTWCRVGGVADSTRRCVNADQMTWHLDDYRCSAE